MSLNSEIMPTPFDPALILAMLHADPLFAASGDEDEDEEEEE